MYQFQDGQIGTVVWHSGNKYGEFISTTGARFTVRAAEVQPFSDGARRLKVREAYRNDAQIVHAARYVARAARREFPTGRALRDYVRGGIFADLGRVAYKGRMPTLGEQRAINARGRE